MEIKPTSYRLADYFLCITSNVPDSFSTTQSNPPLLLDIAYRYPTIDYPDTKMQWSNIPMVLFQYNFSF